MLQRLKVWIAERRLAALVQDQQDSIAALEYAQRRALVAGQRVVVATLHLMQARGELPSAVRPTIPARPVSVLARISLSATFARLTLFGAAALAAAFYLMDISLVP